MDYISHIPNYQTEYFRKERILLNPSGDQDWWLGSCFPFLRGTQLEHVSFYPAVRCGSVTGLWVTECGRRSTPRPSPQEPTRSSTFSLFSQLYLDVISRTTLVSTRWRQQSLHQPDFLNDAWNIAHPRPLLEFWEQDTESKHWDFRFYLW